MVVTQSLPELTAIREALDVMVDPGSVVELRAIKTTKGTKSGYFDDLDKLAGALLAVNLQDTVYITPNPVLPDLLARSVNRVQPYVTATTADDNILRRRWLLTDYDPERPTGISATEEEHELALDRARQAQRFLVDTAGFPADSLIRADSGNGGHVCALVDEPNDPETLALFERCLKALDVRFSDHLVSVDTTVANAARIWKSYGTYARKGDSLPSRPHRLARILEAPSRLTVAPRTALERLADLAPQDGKQSGKHGGALFDDPSDGFDIDGWIRQHGIRVLHEEPWKSGGHVWVLAECPWNADHTDKSAFIVQYPSGVLGAGCKHNHCSGKGWRDLRVIYEPRAYDRRDTSSSSGPTATPTATPVEPEKPSWPEPLAKEAYHGLLGEIVQTIEPHTESDPVAIFGQTLAMFGNRIGKRPHFRVESDRHALKLYVILVGTSSKGRKGTSYGRVLDIFRDDEDPWADYRVISGASSGEGIIWAIRDKIVKSEPIKERGQVVGYQEITTDPGIDDKRLLAYEPEYGSVLRIMGREGNSLSGVLRKAWDQDILSSLTKNSPARATGAHVSIIGHVTDDELRRYLDRTDAANGYGNRHVWLVVRRARILPEGGNLSSAAILSLRNKINQAVDFAKGVDEMRRDEAATRAWTLIYEKLSAGGLGLAGSLTSRAEAQVMRMACIYALMDQSSVVTVDHLAASLAVWEYAAASVKWIFGNSIGDPDADAILQALAANVAGLTREQISVDVFARNRSASQINRALSVLISHGLAHAIREEPERGRPAERWFAGPSANYFV